MMFQRWLTACLCGGLLVWTEVARAEAGHAIVKRSDDTNPLEAVVSKLTVDLTQLQARVVALENARGERVAFWAQTTNADVVANAPIPFSPVFNIGNGYDNSLHVFVAPYSGIYIFTFQIFYHHSGDLLVDLVKNGGIIVRMRVYDPTFETSEASSVTQEVAAGDRFWVTIDRAASLYTGVHSFFSGTMVSADI